MYASLAIVPLAFLASHVAAASTPLLARQLSSTDFPTQCQSQCSIISTTLSSCSTISCLCTESVNQGLFDCLECSLAISSNAALIEEAQTSLSSYESSCSGAGVALSSLTVTQPASSAVASATGSSVGASTSDFSLSFTEIFTTESSSAAAATETSVAEVTTPAATTTAAPAATSAKGTTTADTSTETGILNPLATKNGAGKLVGGSSAVAVAGLALFALAL